MKEYNVRTITTIKSVAARAFSAAPQWLLTFGKARLAPEPPPAATQVAIKFPYRLAGECIRTGLGTRFAKSGWAELGPHPDFYTAVGRPHPPTTIPRLGFAWLIEVVLHDRSMFATLDALQTIDVALWSLGLISDPFNSTHVFLREFEAEEAQCVG